jgi:hypothetical protein
MILCPLIGAKFSFCKGTSVFYLKSILSSLFSTHVSLVEAKHNRVAVSLRLAPKTVDYGWFAMRFSLAE